MCLLFTSILYPVRFPSLMHYVQHKRVHVLCVLLCFCLYVYVLVLVCVCVMCVYVCASKDYKRHRPMNASYEKDAYSNCFILDVFKHKNIYSAPAK